MTFHRLNKQKTPFFTRRRKFSCESCPASERFVANTSRACWTVCRLKPNTADSTKGTHATKAVNCENIIATGNNNAKDRVRIRSEIKPDSKSQTPAAAQIMQSDPQEIWCLDAFATDCFGSTFSRGGDLMSLLEDVGNGTPFEEREREILFGYPDIEQGGTLSRLPKNINGDYSLPSATIFAVFRWQPTPWAGGF